MDIQHWLFIFIMFLLFIVIFEHPNHKKVDCDLNHDNELTIKDLSILAAQINNK